jgi:hypothetical protein
MAINRAPFNALVDYNGSNELTATLWGKDDIKDVLLDPIDALIQYGAWTPTNLSTGFAFSGGTTGAYAKYDKVVFLWCQLVFPVNSSNIACRVGGVPFINRTTVGGWQGYGTQRVWYLPINASEINPLDVNTSANITDAQLSGANIILSAVYKTD